MYENSSNTKRETTPFSLPTTEWKKVDEPSPTDQKGAGIQKLSKHKNYIDTQVKSLKENVVQKKKR